MANRSRSDSVIRDRAVPVVDTSGTSTWGVLLPDPGGHRALSRPIVIETADGSIEYVTNPSILAADGDSGRHEWWQSMGLAL